MTSVGKDGERTIQDCEVKLECIIWYFVHGSDLINPFLRQSTKARISLPLGCRETLVLSYL